MTTLPLDLATLTIDVVGHPAPKGSKKCVGSRGKAKHVLVEMSPLLPDWTAAVVRAARARMALTGWRTEHGPVEVEIVAWFPRPKSAPDRRYPHTRAVGDADKIARGCLDPLVVAGVLADDSLAVDVIVRERYAEKMTGARIVIRSLA